MAIKTNWMHDQTVADGATYTIKMVENMLVAAFEGGCNYWLDQVQTIFPSGHSYEDYKHGGKYHQSDIATEPCYNAWKYEGGKLNLRLQPECLGDHEKIWFVFDYETAIKGFELMREKTPRHWNDMMAQNDDAITADVWLQLCLFGEVVYG